LLATAESRSPSLTLKSIDLVASTVSPERLNLTERRAASYWATVAAPDSVRTPISSS
jgi:hypothetical protein